MTKGSLTSRFESALVYASQVHGGHKRKGTEIPYVAHLLGVASLVLEDGGDEDEAIAALLHDAPEDRGGRGRLDDVCARFGDRVASIIDGCTDTYETPKPPYVQRKRGHMRRLRREAGLEILRVTAADKLNNARAILADFERLGETLFERFTEKKSGTLWYYACMVNLLCDRFPGALTGQFARVVKELWEGAAPNAPWP